MNLIHQIVFFLKRIIEPIKSISRIVRPSAIRYRLSSVDIENQTLILHLTHKNIFIKQSFAEIIANPSLINGIDCEEACWIGIYYGKALHSAISGKTHLKNIKKPNYLLQHHHGSYKIISEHRDGKITCLHMKTKKTLCIEPLSIAKDSIFIHQFDPTQACYIGILAGIKMDKEKDTTSVPFLRLVK